MAGKKTGKRLLTWVLVLVMALSLLPLNALAAEADEAAALQMSDEDNSDDRSLMPTKDTYTITFDANGGTFADGTKQYVGNYSSRKATVRSQSPKDDPTNPPYVFKGWYKKFGIIETDVDIKNDNVKVSDVLIWPSTSRTLYARWSLPANWEVASIFYLKDPTCNHDSNTGEDWCGPLGGTTAGFVDTTGFIWKQSATNASVENSMSVQPDDVTWPSGYGTPNKDGLKLDKNTAVWNDIFEAFKTKVEADNGVGSLTEDQVDSITLVPYKVSRGNQTYGNYHVDCDVVIKCNFVTVDFVVKNNSGDFDSILPNGKMTCPKGQAFPQNKVPTALEKDGYEFDGWYADEEYKEKADFDKPLTTDTTFYGKYEPVKTYNVTYTDGVDGEEVFKDQVYTNLRKGADTPAFDGGKPNRAGYEFLGWEPEFADKVSEDVTYTAQWKAKEYSFTVNYRWDNKPIPNIPSTTGSDALGIEVIPNTDIDGYTLISGQPQSMTIGTGKNELNLNYRKNVTLTANSDSVTYDGKAHTVTGYTSAPDKGVTFEGITATGSGTNAGEYDVKFVGESVVGTYNNLYIVTKTVDGKLTITEASAPTPATVTLRETDANGNALIKKHLTITAKEAETIKDAYFCVAVTAADGTTKTAFTTNPRYATTTTVDNMTRTSDGTAVEGSFVFPEESVLTFTEEGTYIFTVKEVFDESIKVNHTTYDNTVYTMTVTVTKDATENKLNAAVSFTTDGQTEPTGSITFNNIYKTPVIPTYTFDLSNLNTIKVNKEFVSRYGRSATMSFEATATIEKKEAYIITDSGINTNASNSAAAAKSDYTKVVEAAGIVTLKTGKTGVFQFSGTYDLKPGDYRITVKETNSGDRYVTYDDATHTYDFIVDANGEINIDTPITCTFTNMYTKRHSAAAPSKPTLNTGDHYAYVMGYPDGTVRPNGSITRAEVSTILFRLLSDKTRDEYFTTESSFTDVKAGAWYNNSIATLEKAGVIVDTAKGGAFRPNEAITRAELAAMLAQFSDAKPVKGVKFSDVSAGHWAYEAIAIAAKMGWIEGYPDGTFRPDATITRAEMMTLVNRALERVPSDEDHLLSKRVMLTFPDCKSGDWFYIAVQEATNSHTYERAATEKNGDEQWTALRANRDWTQLEK